MSKLKHTMNYMCNYASLFYSHPLPTLHSQNFRLCKAIFLLALSFGHHEISSLPVSAVSERYILTPLHLFLLPQIHMNIADVVRLRRNSRSLKTVHAWLHYCCCSNRSCCPDSLCTTDMAGNCHLKCHRSPLYSHTGQSSSSRR